MASRPSRPRCAWPCPHLCVGGRRRDSAGFTIVEMLGVLAVVGVLAALGVTSSRGALKRGQNAQAIAEIMEMDVLLKEYRATYDSLPLKLAAVGRRGFRDPWGRRYQYARISDLMADRDDDLEPRKDRFLKPVNTDYDLFSKGADGRSRQDMNAVKSLDDIVRAFDGGFVGIGKDF